MIIQPPQAPLSLVLAQLGRAIAAVSATLPPPRRSAVRYDPVFLPDFATFTPDQAQEMRYRKGRDQ